MPDQHFRYGSPLHGPVLVMRDSLQLQICHDGLYQLRSIQPLVHPAAMEE